MIVKLVKLVVIVRNILITLFKKLFFKLYYFVLCYKQNNLEEVYYIITRMNTAPQFSLRWNNYVNHVTDAFNVLRLENEFVDVTLCCEGGKIKAHRMLLSACSTYFRQIFKENPCQHPVIIFRNVKFEDLNAIVNFMYHGEVNIFQEQLESFLITAELLEVKGLTDSTEEDVSRNQTEINENISLDLSSKSRFDDETIFHSNSSISDEPINLATIQTYREETVTHAKQLPEKESFDVTETISENAEVDEILHSEPTILTSQSSEDMQIDVQSSLGEDLTEKNPSGNII